MHIFESHYIYNLYIYDTGTAIVRRFLQMLTRDHPVFTSILPADILTSEKHVQAVVDILYHYAVNCDNLAVMEHEISDMISMAVNLDMEGWHYPLIAKSVVDALRYDSYSSYYIHY